MRMEAARRRPTALDGLSRFLIEHEACGVGFDVSHPAGLGSGRLSMTCRGCGRAHEYAAATIEVEREIEVEPVTVTARPPARPLATPRNRRLPTRRSRDRAIVAGLLAVSIAALAFAGIRLSTGTGESSAPVAAATHPNPTRAAPRARTRSPQAAATPNPQAGQAKRETPSRGQGEGAAAAKPPTRPVAGEKLVKTPRFSLIVPDSWRQRTVDGGLLLAPPGAAPTSVSAFYESNVEMTLQAMSAKTAEFLRSRAPTGTIVSSKRLRVGGHPAFKLRDRSPAGSETALGVLADPYRYLVVTGVEAGAAAPIRAAAARALRSFRPR